MALKCAYTFCTKTFRTERGRNAHYGSAEGRFHGRTATSSLKRKLSDYDDPSHDHSTYEENTNSPMPEGETTASDLQDITLEQLEIDDIDETGVAAGDDLHLRERERWLDAAAIPAQPESAWKQSSRPCTRRPWWFVWAIDGDLSHVLRDEGAG